MNAPAVDPAMTDTSTMTSHACTYQHQRHPNACSNPLNFEWTQDISLRTDDDDVAMCLGSAQIDSRRSPTAFHHLDESETEGHSVEWVQQSDDDDDMQDSATQPYSVSSAASSVLWYHSRLASTPSASTSVDSLGLHHVTSFPAAAAAGDPSALTIYDKASFNTIGAQHELPELDITQISPSSGDPLINWRSPPGFSYCSLHGDEFGSLLGQKRRREDDPELVNGCKRRRTPVAG